MFKVGDLVRSRESSFGGFSKIWTVVRVDPYNHGYGSKVTQYVYLGRGKGEEWGGWYNTRFERVDPLTPFEADLIAYIASEKRALGLL